MPSITIKFGLWIDENTSNNPHRLKGPIFSKWLPDGESDSIKIRVAEHSAEVLLWFEQHGFINEDGFIEYEHKKQEIDPAIVPTQLKIHTGALYGKVNLNSVPESQILALKTNDTENDEYIRLGKLVLKKILDPVLLRFTKILKNTYGQNWISEYHQFDSREISLANRCSDMSMRWYINNDEYGDFIPGTTSTKSVRFTVNILTDGREYISRNSWFRIEELLNNQFETSISSEFASRSNRLLDESRYSHSLLEAVTALELSIDEYIRRVIERSPEIDEHLWKYLNTPTPLPTKVSLIASLTGANIEDIAKASIGIIERNKFVHDGIQINESASELIKASLKIVSHLNLQELKYPSSNEANGLVNTSLDTDQ